MIYIGFGTNKKWLSKLICWATESNLSHVWIEYDSETFKGKLAFHSWGRLGVSIDSVQHLRRDYPIYRLYRVNQDLSDGFIWAKEQISKGYDYGVIWNGILLVLYRATKLQWLWNILTRNAAKFSCSEFVTCLIKVAKVEGSEVLDAELTTPGDLERFCSSSDKFVLCDKV